MYSQNVIIFSYRFEHEWMKWKTETYWKKILPQVRKLVPVILNITLNKITGT
jgi:hypothetical protein